MLWSSNRFVESFPLYNNNNNNNLFIPNCRSESMCNEYTELPALLYTKVIPLNVEQENSSSRNFNRKKGEKERKKTYNNYQYG